MEALDMSAAKLGYHQLLSGIWKTFDANKGLGFLHFGREYWFRVAARNAYGLGPFSVLLSATPLALPSGTYLHVAMLLCLLSKATSKACSITSY